MYINWDLLFTRAGIYQLRHVVLRSGRHTGIYADFTILFNRHRRLFNLVCQSLADLIRPGIKKSDAKPLTIVTLGIKGALYGYQVYRILRRRKIDCRYIFIERRPDGSLYIPYDQQQLLKGAEVVFLDDACVTGLTALSVANVLRAYQAEINQYIVVLNRSGVGSVGDDQGTLLIESLLKKEIPTWPTKDDCECCIAGMPYATDFGRSSEEAFHRTGNPVAKTKA
jgi:orotate phosphoribosyltransferase